MKQKNGYDQFFKNAQAVAQKGKEFDKNPWQKMAKPKKLFTNPNAPIDEIRQQIRNENSQNQKRKSKKKIQIPWKLAGLSFLGLILTFYVFDNFEKVEKFISKIEIQMMGSAIGAQASENKSAEATENKKAETSENNKIKSTDGKSLDSTASTAANDSNKKDWSQNDINHFSRLNERKKELEARELELTRMENEVAAQKEELEKRMKELEKVRTNISSVLDEKVKADNEKIETLVQMYSTMKAQQAAKIFETMDEDLSVEIIGRMKKKNAAEILNLLKPEKAQAFSEKFAGYKKK